MQRQRINISKLINECLIVIKPDLVKCSGFDSTFRILQKYIPDDDIQRIQCELKNSGFIAAWDMLINVLRQSGKDSFVELWEVILTEDIFTDIREKFNAICHDKGLSDLRPCNGSRSGTIANHQGTDVKDFQHTYSRLRSTESTNSWSSFESENGDAFNHAQSSFDDDQAKLRRQRYGSSSSRNNFRDGSQGSKNSLDQPFSHKNIKVEDYVVALPNEACRKLCDKLNLEHELGNDWRHFAEKLGMDRDKIEKIAQSTNEKMNEVFKYMAHQLKTIEEFIEILCSLKRKDCISILRDCGVQGIKEDYLTSSFLTPTIGNEILHDEEHVPVQETSNILEKEDMKDQTSNADAIPMKNIKTTGIAHLPVQEIDNDNYTDSTVPLQETGSKSHSNKKKDEKFMKTPESHCLKNKDCNDLTLKSETSREQPTNETIPIQETIKSEENSYSEEKCINLGSCGSQLSINSGTADGKLRHCVVLPIDPKLSKYTSSKYDQSQKNLFEETSLVSNVNKEPFQDISNSKKMVTSKGNSRLIESDGVFNDIDEQATRKLGIRELSSSTFSKAVDESNAATNFAGAAEFVSSKYCPNKLDSDDLLEEQSASPVSSIPYLSTGSTRGLCNTMEKEMHANTVFTLSSYLTFVCSLFVPCVLLLMEWLKMGRRPIFPNRSIDKAYERYETTSISSIRQTNMHKSMNNHVENRKDVATGLHHVENVSTYYDDKGKCDLASKGSKLKMRRKMALIISNSQYEMIPSLAPANGTEKLRKNLIKYGWEVERQADLAQKKFSSLIDDFLERVVGDVALVFYFGHSVQMQGSNYLLPVDVDFNDIKTASLLKKNALNLGIMQEKLSQAEASILFVDAGRQLQGFKAGFSDTTPINNQCTLFCTSENESNRFVADKLVERMEKSEDCRSVAELIDPFKDDFMCVSFSRHLLPISLTSMAAAKDCIIPGLKSPEPDCPRHAFVFKVTEETNQMIGNLSKDWTVVHSNEEDDMEADFQRFVENINDDSSNICFFYYEGGVIVRNEQLFLQSSASSEECMDMSWILSRLSETFMGPRLVVINAIGQTQEIDKIDLKDLPLQEVFLMMPNSCRSREDGEYFFEQLFTLLQNGGLLKPRLISLSEAMDVTYSSNSLFYA